MVNEGQIPDIRFDGFAGEWEAHELGEIGLVAMCRRIFKEQTTESEAVPFYKIGTFGGEADAYISRELYEEYKSKYPYPKTGDLLISAAGSIGKVVEYKGEAEYFQDSNIVWLNHNDSLVSAFLKQFYATVQWGGLEGSTLKRLYNKDILEMVIKLPSIGEQTAIGNFFRNLDDFIDLKKQQYEQTVNIKKAMLEKMFPKNGADVPEIRFDGFTGAWEAKKLGEIAPLRGGFAFQSEHFCDSGVPIVKISNILPSGTVGGSFDYYCEQADDANYTLPDKAAVLAMSGATTGKVSILNNPQNLKYYQNQRVGYFVDTENADYSFVSTLVQHDLFADKLSSVLVAGAQPNVSPKSIDNFEFFIPLSLPEQAAIGSFFHNLSTLITTQQQELEKLQNIKKACLSKMFV